VVEGKQALKPFFSIGVTTYNRHDLLRETLNSVLAQSFADFEIIVGNDYQAEVLTGEMLGINDPRIRIINHPVNLREVGNMNALLAEASGRYFTWLFDDDLYEPGFLQTAYDVLSETDFPPALFSSFRTLREGEEYLPRTTGHLSISMLSGREFLRRYSAVNPEVVSTCGLFDTVALKHVTGGIEELCASAIGVYCEYLFLVRCALFDRIAYTDAPFYVFRTHDGSWSESNDELHRYIEAGKVLVRKCGEVLRHPTLIADFPRNLLTICEQHLIAVAYRSARHEVARQQLGFRAVFRAVARQCQEYQNTVTVFIEQGGDTGIRTQLSFLRIECGCLFIMLHQFAYYFYVSMRKKVLNKNEEKCP
jgi:glycosyltransferase involved in cell wall biosynthesis